MNLSDHTSSKYASVTPSDASDLILITSYYPFSDNIIKSLYGRFKAYTDDDYTVKDVYGGM